MVSGTTATHGSGRLIGRDDAAVQTTYILDKIAASLKSLGGRLEDVVRTRVYLSNVDDWEVVSRVHGSYFGTIRPANTMLQAGALIGDGYRVEVEAEAIVDDGRLMSTGLLAADKVSKHFGGHQAVDGVLVLARSAARSPD